MRIFVNPRSPILSVVEGYRGDGVDLKEAQRRAGLRIGDLVESGQIAPEKVSIAEVFQALVFMGREQEINLESAVSVAEAISSSYFPQLLTRIATPKVLGGYQYYVAPIEELYTEIPEPVNGNYGHYSRITGSEGPELVLESMAYETTGMGEYEISIRNRKFGRIIEVTREMILFDRTGSVMANLGNYGNLWDVTGQRWFSSVRQVCLRPQQVLRWSRTLL